MVENQEYYPNLNFSELKYHARNWGGKYPNITEINLYRVGFGWIEDRHNRSWGWPWCTNRPPIDYIIIVNSPQSSDLNDNDPLNESAIKYFN